MSNSEKKRLIIRSRFQPFTTFHAKIIEDSIKSKNQVVVCIIRDYETISRWHRMSPDISSVDLRHLPIFNPFTSWEVYLHVQSSLQKISTLAPHTIPIIISPLKFSELVDVMTSADGKVVPQDLKMFINVHPCDMKTYNQCNIKDNLGKIISIISYDTMPPKFELGWLFGMFDLEDKNDLNIARSKFLPASVEEYKFSNPPKYLLNRHFTDLGLYGQYILWIYLQFVKSYLTETQYRWRNTWPIGVPNDLQNIEFLSSEIKNIANVLKQYLVDKNEWNNYVKKVSDILRDLLQRFNLIPESEQKVLLNCSKFIELANNSIKVYEG